MDILLIGAKVLAAIHTGTVKDLSCSTCTEDTKEQLNCSLNDCDEYVFESYDADLELCTCPLKYVTPEILRYYDRYQYSEIYHTPGHTLDTITAREWEWTKEYVHWLNTYRNDATKNGGSPSEKDAQTKDNLSALKAQFLSNKP